MKVSGSATASRTIACGLPLYDLPIHHPDEVIKEIQPSTCRRELTAVVIVNDDYHIFQLFLQKRYSGASLFRNTTALGAESVVAESRGVDWPVVASLELVFLAGRFVPDQTRHQRLQKLKARR